MPWRKPPFGHNAARTPPFGGFPVYLFYLLSGPAGRPMRLANLATRMPAPSGLLRIAERKAAPSVWRHPSLQGGLGGRKSPSGRGRRGRGSIFKIRTPPEMTNDLSLCHLSGRRRVSEGTRGAPGCPIEHAGGMFDLHLRARAGAPSSAGRALALGPCPRS